MDTLDKITLIGDYTQESISVFFDYIKNNNEKNRENLLKHRIKNEKYNNEIIQGHIYN